MGQRRETPAPEAALAGVEEDVERKRHVKDPFREPFVALVAAPFDSFLGKSSLERGAREVNAALQQDITARSQQVHLRLEILRRQVQSLMLESSAVLDVTSTVANKESKPNAKVAGIQEAIDDQGVNDLERLLEKVALYESGELSSMDIQRSWRRVCSCTDHKVSGADAKLESLRAAVDEAYEAVRESELQYYGPQLPSDSCDESDTDGLPYEGMAQFLEECKRSIKPFFLEDFVQQGEDTSQTEDAGDLVDDCNPSSPEDTLIQAQEQPFATTPPMDDVEMSEDEPMHPELRQALQVDHASDATATRPVRFDVNAASLRREAMHTQALKIRAETHRSRKNPISIISSRHTSLTKTSQASISSCQHASIKRSVSTPSKSKPLELQSDPRAWRDFSLSVIDPSINLQDLRQRLSVQWEPASGRQQPETVFAEHAAADADNSSCWASPDAEPTSVDTCVQEAAATSQPKRQPNAVAMPQPKKQRVDPDPRPARPLTLRALMQRVETKLRRIAETSCVSYLSSLLRSSLANTSPQRAFVALVFSASLANAAPDQVSSRSDTGAPANPLCVTLQPAHDGRDVKVICRQE